jgi:hypothetical protein
MRNLSYTQKGGFHKELETCISNIKNKMLSIKINLVRNTTLSLIKMVTLEFTNPNPAYKKLETSRDSRRKKDFRRKIKQNQKVSKMGVLDFGLRKSESQKGEDSFSSKPELLQNISSSNVKERGVESKGEEGFEGFGNGIYRPNGPAS